MQNQRNSYHKTHAPCLVPENKHPKYTPGAPPIKTSQKNVPSCILHRLLDALYLSIPVITKPTRLLLQTEEKHTYTGCSAYSFPHCYQYWDSIIAKNYGDFKYVNKRITYILYQFYCFITNFSEHIKTPALRQGIY